MSDATRLLDAMGRGDPHAAAELLPVVYDELRKLASKRLAGERPDHTLQATALVHEAYLRLVDGENVQYWNNRGHFFSAAAEAIRRILIESARRRESLKRDGDREREALDAVEIVAPHISEDILALDEALNRLAIQDPQSAELVKLRYFAGLTIPQAAEMLSISPRKADQLWSFARAWLRRELAGD